LDANGREPIKELQAKKGFICDMDGVIYYGSRLLPGAMEFVCWWIARKKSFLFLTINSSMALWELKMELVLVLSGAVTPETMGGFPYRPIYVLPGVGDISK
jgi:ribonucleotide monophosphatase NagD (HAD superfamily)